jgi:hypothetical protein
MTEGGNVDGTGNEGMERDLDDDVPYADEFMGRAGGAEGEGSDGEEEEADTGAFVEAGEGDLEEEDEDAMMGRDLDDDIPDGFGDEYDDDQHDLDDDIPSASEDEDDEDEDDDYEDKDEEVGDDCFMARNLDSDIPDAADEDGGVVEEQEWEHTDTDADDDEDDEDEDEDTNEVEMAIEQQPPRRPHQLSRDLFRVDVSALAEPVRLMPQQPPRRETEAERLFLERWGDGDGSADFGSGDNMMPEPSLRIPRRRTRRYSAETDSSNSID